MPTAGPASAIAAANAATQGKHRPRPSLSAPFVYDRSASAASDTGATSDTGEAAATARTDEAAVAAPKEKKSRRPSRLGGYLRRVRKLVIVLAVLVAAVLALRAYVVAPYYVPSASMEPTLHGCPGCNNDHVLVEKLSYDFHDPRRGDIVVFDNPGKRWSNARDGGGNVDKVLIKRVIGVPGDRIVIRRGRVFINGSAVDESYLNSKCRPRTTGSSESRSERAREFDRVPKGDLFVMGDNRCNSEDSRAFGVVPIDKVIGKAVLIVWPFGRFGSP
ncbi:MAG: signal peptidase I [Jatrophihabitantaceae bacterium]